MPSTSGPSSSETRIAAPRAPFRDLDVLGRVKSSPSQENGPTRPAVVGPFSFPIHLSSLEPPWRGPLQPTRHRRARPAHGASETAVSRLCTNSVRHSRCFGVNSPSQTAVASARTSSWVMVCAMLIDRKTPDPESDAWQQADYRSEPATEEPPDLHQFVHQRLRTTMEILGREPKDQARS